MKTLTKDGFDRAKNFIQTQGRPLEQALFKLEFENGSVDDVLIQLGEYQNPDGGFGNALEPDVRTPTSSALRTPASSSPTSSGCFAHSESTSRSKRRISSGTRSIPSPFRPAESSCTGPSRAIWSPSPFTLRPCAHSCAFWLKRISPRSSIGRTLRP